MKPADDIEQSIRDLRFTTRAATDERILANAEAALGQSPTKPLNPKQSGIWRMIMKNNVTKLAATAATIVIVAGLALLTLDGSTQPAYALAQTIEANRCLKCFHIRIDPPSFGSLGEAWGQFDDDGELLILRMDFPATEDGPKVVIWEDDKAEVWFKKKNSAVVVREKNITDRLRDSLQAFNPRVAMEELYDAEAQGTVTIKTQEPSAAGEPITLIVSFNDDPDRQEVYTVNPETKLVEQIEKYQLNGKEYALVSRHKYLDYDEPIDPFILELPDDVMRIDQTTQIIGLAKGDLTDEEITVKVIREFFEALIAKDYTKAGQLFGGMPAAKVQEYFGKIDVVRIISIGKPKPHPIPGVGGTRVPCTVEVEKDGVRSPWKTNPAVRPVYSQRDRWNIHGGI